MCDPDPDPDKPSSKPHTNTNTSQLATSCSHRTQPKMPAAGLKTIIALSFVLAVGFLLVILSCALWKVYYPLLVVATYVIAPVPNWICSRVSNPDDFVESSGNAVLDLGRFITGFFVVMGIGKCPGLGLPFIAVLHSEEDLSSVEFVADSPYLP